ncbi:hypothetical protein EST38_g6241 [Candolleomyces aberdarensis]|uniref:Uncharacterized protein n=1 Tax=Candolleomyces aberdarensis TaxID=2316362 RepID=A0A4Q2DIA3_9AGAR|nr:hypothetical protein EST38_g6241 [Candolleomyces aberdarensis]
MVEYLCDCASCYNLSDDDARLQSGRNLREHQKRYGQPTDAQRKRRAEQKERQNRRQQRRNRARTEQAPQQPDGSHTAPSEALDGNGDGENGNGGWNDAGLEGGEAGQGEGVGTVRRGGLAGAGEVFPDTLWNTVYIPRMDGEHAEEWDAPDDPDSDNENLLTAPAYSAQKLEPPYIRMAYLQAVLNNVTGNTPVRQTEANLRTSLAMLDVARGLPAFPVPARTLRTARRRVGVDPDQWIIQYAACPQCWKLYMPEAVIKLDSPSCTIPGCTGNIYMLGEKGKRRPLKIIPQVSLITSLRRMLLRKGFRRQLRDSRGSPVGQNDDPHFVMKDIHDGEVWHELRTGIKRELGNQGNVRDIGHDGGEGSRLTEHRLGLHMTVNLDW